MYHQANILLNNIKLYFYNKKEYNCRNKTYLTVDHALECLYGDLYDRDSITTRVTSDNQCNVINTSEYHGAIQPLKKIHMKANSND